MDNENEASSEALEVGKDSQTLTESQMNHQLTHSIHDEDNVPVLNQGGAVSTLASRVCNLCDSECGCCNSDGGVCCGEGCGCCSLSPDKKAECLIVGANAKLVTTIRFLRPLLLLTVSSVNKNSMLLVVTNMLHPMPTYLF